MKKTTIIAILVIVVLATFSGWYYQKNTKKTDLPAAQSLIDNTIYAATGTVSSLSSDRIDVSLSNGSVMKFVLQGSSQIFTFKPVASSTANVPVVVVYSKSLAQPLAAFLSEPFENTDTSGNIDIVSGKLVSIKDRTLKISVENKVRTYVFNEVNPLTSISLLNFSDIKIGNEISVEYTKSHSEFVLVRASIK